ncbi:hypothetical protein JCM9492_11250 [Aquifex pyrophilus]
MKEAVAVKVGSIIRLKGRAEESFVYRLVLDTLMANFLGTKREHNMIDGEWFLFDKSVEPLVKKLLKEGIFIRSEVSE